ncbi:hypothetical protein ACERK3_09415 [Phycisphaerales bacterium AB-hyl4]|uniref:Uncharacterized protein n=1 Tax=Natronomicrosphaera hydrolytica TaxID=3242702 RepID=A0ABV4U4J1_9BACT
MMSDPESNLSYELRQIKDSMRRIEHSLNGNGQPGIKTRLALIEHWIRDARRVVVLVIGSALAAVSSAVVVLVKAAVGGLS